MCFVFDQLLGALLRAPKSWSKHLFSAVFKKILIKNLFQWFHAWNQQKNVWKWTKKHVFSYFVYSSKLCAAPKSWSKYKTHMLWSADVLVYFIFISKNQIRFLLLFTLILNLMCKYRSRHDTFRVDLIFSWQTKNIKHEYGRIKLNIYKKDLNNRHLNNRHINGRSHGVMVRVGASCLALSITLL